MGPEKSYQNSDNGGHDAADVVVISLARLLKQTGSEVDLPRRLGGEEFALIKAADTALYRAKAQSRNRVECAGRKE